MLEEIKSIISTVSGLDASQVKEFNIDTTLRGDIGLDSLALAELTVEIEDRYDIDIFETGNVDTIGEILAKL